MGAGKMQVSATAAVLMLLVAISVVATTIVEAADQTSLDAASTGGACCDLCLCTKSIPPQCRCSDIKTSCYKGCKSCLCTRSFPPQCRCTDIQNFCYPSCKGAALQEGGRAERNALEYGHFICSSRCRDVS